MEKIKIKIKIHELIVLNQMFELNTEYQGKGDDDKELKMIKNISNLLRNKFRKLAITKEFDTKPFTIKFEYFEAYFLEKIIQYNHYIFQHMLYEFSVLDRLVAILNQQLV
jgi:hypothetical protein